jgi:hypothetical protein
VNWTGFDRSNTNRNRKYFINNRKNSIIGPKVYDNVINLYKLIDIQEVPLFNDTRINLDFVELLYPKESEINSHALTLIFENNNNCLNLKFELEKYELLKSNITHTSLERSYTNEKI